MKQVIRIKVLSYDSTLVDSAVKKIIDVANRTGASIVGPVPLPSRIKKWTVPTSPVIDKRSQEAYEMRVSIRLIDILGSNNKTVDALRFLELPAGITTDVQILDK